MDKQTITLRYGQLEIPVRVIGFRDRSGVVEYLITPLHGSGSGWIASDRLSMV